MKGSNIRYLMPYLANRRWWWIGCFVYALFSGSASAFSPFLLGQAIDELRRGVRLPLLLLYASGILGLAVLLALFRYLLRMLTGDMAATVSYEMSRDFFARLLVLDKHTLDEFGSGDLLSRATGDFVYVWRFFSAGFQMMLHAVVLMIIGCVLMASASPLLAAVVFGFLAITILAQVRLGRVLQASFKVVQQEMAHLSAFAQEHLTTVRMIKAYNQEQQVSAAFAEANQQYAHSNLQFVLRSGLIAPIPGVVVRLTAAIVLAVGGTLVIGGDLTLGQFVQFIVYLGLLSNAAVQISSAYERLQQGAAATGRIAEVLLREPRIADAPDAVAAEIKGAVKMEGVGVRASGRSILHDIDFEVPAGSVVGIVGPTGAGKSTLLSLIARVQDPQVGRVLVDGVDLRSIRLDDFRRALAIVPQETLLFGMSIRDNITLGLHDVPDEDVERAIERARLAKDLEQFPQRLQTPVGERGATLSGGQKQRTAIARALVRDPRILLLDDPLASVDAETASQIIAGLAGDGRRTTFIVSQHLLAVRRADLILVLDGGTIVERGTHDELLALGGRYAAMVERELRRDAADVDVEEAFDAEEPEPVAAGNGAGSRTQSGRGNGR
ncbi:MAG TPA: ABC transporter ATP-binding protein [Herpetosiphonaceae bacterium]|nr:ABC transporter ATP-binding protein [Herpetosiphonaceae bacterium]